MEYLKTIAFTANQRLLRTERLSDDCVLGAAWLAELPALGAVRGHWVLVFPLGDTRAQARLGAVPVFAFQPEGLC